MLSNCPTQSIVLTGYSLGAWIIDDWLRRNKDVCSSRQPAGNCEDVSPNIVAVELYGDPLWHRKGNAYLGGPVVTFDGLARQLGLHLGNNHDRPDPYTDTHQGLMGLRTCGRAAACTVTRFVAKAMRTHFSSGKTPYLSVCRIRIVNTKNMRLRQTI